MKTLFLLFPFVLAGADFRWVERAENRLELTEDGASVFVYNHGPDRACCYLHPVSSPKGVVVTDDGPADHPHHKGVFWAWPVVETGGVKMDLWMRKRGISQRFERIVERSVSPAKATLAAEHSWVADGKRIARESLSITARPAQNGARAFDVSVTLEALTAPIRIAGAPEQGKGYGGVSVRFAPRKDTILRTSEGTLAKDEDHSAHVWSELQGTFVNGTAALRMTSVTANEWCLRHYGFLGANFPGVGGYLLEPSHPLTLRYELRVSDVPRVLILTGRNNHDWRTTTPALKAILTRGGRFDVQVTEDPASLTDAALAPYDVLLSDYNGPRWGPTAEAAIEQFVRSGKGFVATHAAAYAFGDMEILGDRHVKTGVFEPPWPAYGEMIGARWSSQPPRTGHGKRHTFEVKWIDGGEKSFTISDELYHNFRMRPEGHVLATAFDAPEFNGTGRDEPIAWTVPFGKGRVFYTTLGHDTQAIAAPGFAAMLTRAVLCVASF